MKTLQSSNSLPVPSHQEGLMELSLVPNRNVLLTPVAPQRNPVPRGLPSARHGKPIAWGTSGAAGARICRLGQGEILCGLARGGVGGSHLLA